MELAVDVINQLKSIVGSENIFLDEERKQDYAHDKTEDYFFMPAAVVRPVNTKEVSEVLKVCNQYKIPVTPRGAGTGLAGGAIPTHKGVVLSMERFNKILNIDELNLPPMV